MSVCVFVEKWEKSLKEADRKTQEPQPNRRVCAPKVSVAVDIGLMRATQLLKHKDKGLREHQKQYCHVQFRYFVARINANDQLTYIKVVKKEQVDV